MEAEVRRIVHIVARNISKHACLLHSTRILLNSAGAEVKAPDLQRARTVSEGIPMHSARRCSFVGKENKKEGGFFPRSSAQRLRT